MSDSLPSFPPPADEHPLRGRVLDVLIDDGLSPSLDDDGDVAFVLEEQKLFVRCTDGPPAMLRLFGQWRITAPPADDDELRWLRAASTVNATHNLAKISVYRGILVVAVDAVVPDDAPLDLLFRTSTRAVLAAVTGWHHEVERQQAD
ncbi:hypothetical protein GCM10028777_25640 [Angustibacter speluncae]